MSYCQFIFGLLMKFFEIFDVAPQLSSSSGDIYIEVIGDRHVKKKLLVFFDTVHYRVYLDLL